MVNYGDRALMQKKAEATKKKWESILASGKHRCKNCREDKPIDEFVKMYMSNQWVGKYRFLYECKACKRKRTYAKRAKKRTTIAGTMDIVIKHLHQGAKKRNLTFVVTKQDLLDLWEQQKGLCYYSWYPMQYTFVGYKNGKLNAKVKYQLSCDRLNNDLWYTLDNIVLCCTFVNKMKWNLSESEFYQVCKDILQTKKS